MLECVLQFDRRGRIIEHFYQSLCGFLYLCRQHKVTLKLEEQSSVDIPFINTFGCRINGQQVFYDLSDGSDNFEVAEARKILEERDAVLFKRAYDRSHYGGEQRIYPYGLNYIALQPWVLRAVGRCVRSVNSSRLWLKYLNTVPETCWSMRHPRSSCRNKIIFCTRLWNNEDELNQMRIDLARQIKKRFQSDAVVGISDNLLSRQMCPDLILPGNVYARKNFISLVNDSSICIATTGLFRSIGWRFGEFVSAGKAILSEPLYFEVPGEFKAGRNYETFDSIEDALTKCEDLLANPEKIHAMELANQEYYLKNLKPDVLVMNTLKQALQLDGAISLQ